MNTPMATPVYAPVERLFTYWVLELSDKVWVLWLFLTGYFVGGLNDDFETVLLDVYL